MYKTMRKLDLQEYERSAPVRLSVTDRSRLRDILTIEPAPDPDDENKYILIPGSKVGALKVGDLSVSIRPKLPISRVLFLASYAMGSFRPQEAPFDFRYETTLVEALVPAFAAAAHRAFARGLLNGYRAKEEALHTVRGRIRVNEQIRRRFDGFLPIEVRYDDYTEDILPNQLVKAATSCLGKLNIHAKSSREALARVEATLINVTLVEFPCNDIPEVRFDRLNEHYREIVALSRLVLRHSTFETERGGTRAAGFLMDMNVVFQEFVTRALREALQLSDHTFRSDKNVPLVTLDKAGQVRLKPDLSWWDGPNCTFVGDVKYKRVLEGSMPNADLYQILAYTTAFDVPSGLLIYAQGEAIETKHHVRYVGKRLEIAALDLSGTIYDLLSRIDKLAYRIRMLRQRVLVASQVTR